MGLDLPNDVLVWLADIFASCDRRITQKLHNNPNVPEESLDLTWIEHLSQFSSPVALSSEWTAKIESHFLGGLRHFHSWEIADVGVLLFVRRGGEIRHSKVALLQSKRLYPTNNAVREERLIDYEIGFARLADQEDLAHTMVFDRDFEFTDACVYRQLQAQSEQVKAIDDYEEKNKLRVYYQLYNPWTVPLIKHVPILEYEAIESGTGLGTRIIPASVLHKLIATERKGYRPSLVSLAGLVGNTYTYGWPLAYFIADLFLGCTEGSSFDGLQDERVQRLFYRRSGPIAAAIAITIEGP